MDSSRNICEKLPLEIIERVLSFWPVPVLCRMRSVSKTWKYLIARPSFHDLCDHNGRNNVCLFLWREDWPGSRGSIASVITGTFSSLELDAMRWYSIQATELPKVCTCGNEIQAQIMAMDDGLVCELTSSELGMGEKYALTLSDPVAKTLPAPPEICNIYLPLWMMSPAVTRFSSFTTFFKLLYVNKFQQRVYVHESFTNEWRRLRNVPNEEGLDSGIRPSSAVSMNQTVYVANPVYRDFDYDQLSPLSYKPQDEAWAVWRMRFRRKIQMPPILLSYNRLFVMVWFGLTSSKRNLLIPSGRNCPNSESLFKTTQDEPGGLTEMYEILVAEKSRKPMLQLTDAQVRQIFETHFLVNLAYVFPCFESYGICISVVLVSLDGGEVRRYYFATWAVDVLPHPLVQIPENPPPVLVDGDAHPYDAKTMKLSLRNLLAQRLKTSMGWRLLQ